MNTLYLFVAIVLLITIVAGLVRVWRGPTPADRMLAAQLFGSTGVGMLVLLAYAWRTPALVNVALVFALLAAVFGMAFVRRGWLVPTAAGEVP